ncbi:hypothetical protein [Rhizomonospora bruguierae]|uniref:hypothetical protein n=1 Tax=Rhizomonospora bruguierae TaxID=1581705 RepID=UPI0020BF82DB|nr:hypothetical protein [Micromonospora sp. NBRC 107566]
MDRGDRLPDWCEESLCGICPAQLVGVGEFDVSDRPGPDSRYDPHAGYRINVHTGAPTCVHPFRVGLPPARYASDAVPLPQVAPPTPVPAPVHLELPADVADLEGWLVATLRDADLDRMASALARAEATAAVRFDPRHVVAAMRRVLSVELARRS